MLYLLFHTENIFYLKKESITYTSIINETGFEHLRIIEIKMNFVGDTTSHILTDNMLTLKNKAMEWIR